MAYMAWRRCMYAVNRKDTLDLLKACAVKFGKKAIQKRKAIEIIIHTMKALIGSFREIKWKLKLICSERKHPLSKLWTTVRSDNSDWWIQSKACSKNPRWEVDLWNDKVFRGFRRKAGNCEEQDPILRGKMGMWNESTERVGKFFTVDMSSQEKRSHWEGEKTWTTLQYNRQIRSEYQKSRTGCARVFWNRSCLGGWFFRAKRIGTSFLLVKGRSLWSIFVHDQSKREQNENIVEYDNRLERGASRWANDLSRLMSRWIGRFVGSFPRAQIFQRWVRNGWTK